MAEDKVELVSSLYEAFGSGDMDKAGALLANTHWEEMAGMPYGGHYSGAEEIFRSVFGPLASDVRDFSARPDDIVPAGEDRVLALGRYRGEGRMGPLDAAFAHLWTIRDGAIVRFVQYADTHRFREATGAAG